MIKIIIGTRIPSLHQYAYILFSSSKMCVLCLCCLQLYLSCVCCFCASLLYLYCPNIVTKLYVSSTVQSKYTIEHVIQIRNSIRLFQAIDEWFHVNIHKTSSTKPHNRKHLSWKKDFDIRYLSIVSYIASNQ